MADNAEFVGSITKATASIVLDVTHKMDKACLVVENQAKRDCPVDTGALRASINHEVELESDAIVGRIGSNLEYAPYIHNGTGIYAINGDGRKTPWSYTIKSGKYKGKHFTVGQRPKPFLKNAVISSKGRIERMLGY